MVRLCSRVDGYETVCDIYLVPVLLLFAFDIFKYSAEASWMAYITQSINSERRSAGCRKCVDFTVIAGKLVLELTSLASFSKNRFSL